MKGYKSVWIEKKAHICIGFGLSHTSISQDIGPSSAQSKTKRLDWLRAAAFELQEHQSGLLKIFGP